MTDLELVRLCAEAIEFQIVADSNIGPVRVQSPILTTHDCEGHIYDPLHDDAQAMALVKKFPICILWAGADTRVSVGLVYEQGCYSQRQDMNRAICMAVAKMQASK